MANEKTIANAAAHQQRRRQRCHAVVAPLAGWLIPGLGHFIQKRWVRGALIFVSVTVMFFCGLGMSGKIYGFNLGDLLDMLGFVGDFGNGLLYFIARTMDWGPARDLPRHLGLRHQVPGLRRTAQRDRRHRRSPHRHREETMTLNFSHFTAALVFALCASVVFGITQRDNTPRDDPLRPLLLRLVHRRSPRGRLGDVVHQAVACSPTSASASKKRDARWAPAIRAKLQRRSREPRSCRRWLVPRANS